MANEWVPLRIRVNAVAPGTIRTAGLEQYNQQQLQAAVNSLLIPRMGEPDEVAQAVNSLASDAASFIAGSVLELDGSEHLLGAAGR
jgi:NAD(P)-dependent dehydrogenase (short-subunit alcohol dehydrogenase family)